MKKRSDLGFGGVLDDLQGFDKRTEEVSRKPLSKEQLTGVAQNSGFESREDTSKQEVPRNRSRRRRTGRNAQINIKARPETIEEYCAIADRNGWGLGETLEHAIELLRRFDKDGRQKNK